MDQSQSGTGTTTIRSQCRKPITVRVTPLVVSAVDGLEKDIAANV